MKKILVLMFVALVSINAEKIEFFGNYHADERKQVPSDSYGFVGGCIYNGKFSDGNLIKVYTKKACPSGSGKERVGAAISCDVASISKKKIQGKYEMYEGICEVK